MTQPIDALDARILALFRSEPRIGVLEASRRLGVARGTVQARLDRLESHGVVTGWGPDVDPRALGYEVMAFVTLEISQRGHQHIETSLAALPEVLEAHTITGAGDMLVRVVARTNADLQRVVDSVLDIDGVERSNMVIVLADGVPFRTAPLLDEVAQAGS
jgi:DNA-binding Lrp family transcriptional regulator